MTEENHELHSARGENEQLIIELAIHLIYRFYVNGIWTGIKINMSHPEENTDTSSREDDRDHSPPAQSEKESYRPPQLRRYGSLEELTQGLDGPGGDFQALWDGVGEKDFHWSSD